MHRHGLVAELLASPYLTRFPASLDPSPFPDTVRFREPEPEPVRLLPDRRDGSEAPLVYVTFGTVLGYMTIAEDVYRTALAALDGLAVRGLLTVGRTFEASSLGPTAAHVRVEAWVEQADVFGQADLVVCHGGLGTAFGAVAAGVPVLVVPVFADQFENGRRIAGVGAGLVVQASEDGPDASRAVITHDDVPRIAQAVETTSATLPIAPGTASAAEMGRRPVSIPFSTPWSGVFPWGGRQLTRRDPTSRPRWWAAGARTRHLGTKSYRHSLLCVTFVPVAYHCRASMSPEPRLLTALQGIRLSRSCPRS